MQPPSQPKKNGDGHLSFPAPKSEGRLGDSLAPSAPIPTKTETKQEEEEEEKEVTDKDNDDDTFVHCFSEYTKREILKGISLYFNPYSMVGIMGPSGCGKTTFLDLLTGRRRSGKFDVCLLYLIRTINKLNKKH